MMKMNATTWIISILFGILVLAGFTVGIIELAGNAAIAREKARLKALHKPISIAEITPPEIPDDENAAVGLVEALELIAKYEDNKPIREALKSLKKDETDNAELKKIIADKDVVKAVEIAKRASEKPGCWWNMKYSDGYDMLMPYLSGFRNLICFMCLHGVLESGKEKVHQAYKTYLTALNLSFFQNNDPVLVSQLVQYACDCAVIESIKQILLDCFELE